MIRYVLKRIIWLIPVIIAVSFIVFTLMELAPGNFIDAIMSEEMTPEERQELIERHNLHRPMIYRYGLYMLNLVQGDLGVSDHTQISVWGTFINRLPNTLILSFSALIIGVAISIPLGMIAARRAGSLADNAVTLFALIGMSMPLFWLGLMLLLVFSLYLRWLPSGAFDDGIRSLVLPALCSSLSLMANSARQTRSNMLEVLKADYLRTALAKGVPEETVIRKHALGNAWIPIITSIGGSLSRTMAGSAIVETVFSIPGLGRFMIDGINRRDYPVIQSTMLIFAFTFIIVNTLVDLLYGLADPRIKYD